MEKHFRLLNEEDINNMRDIIISYKTTEDKAIELSKYCDYNTLLYNYNYNSNIKNRRCLAGIIKAYEEYNRKNILFLSTNKYSIDAIDLETRIVKLKMVDNIISSNLTDYEKAAELVKLYPSYKKFKMSYTLLSRYGLTDPKLNSISELLNKMDLYLETFKKYDEENMLASAKYYNSFSNYFRDYEYAKFAVEFYIESDEILLENILYRLNLTENEFEYYVKAIKELDPDLYSKYENKVEYNKITVIENYKNNINDLVYGIQNGKFQDGKTFNLLEFVKRIPFRDNTIFLIKIRNFMNMYTPNVKNIIVQYMFTNKMGYKYGLRSVPKDTFYSTKQYINNREILENEIKLVLDYLELNDYPITNETYRCALNMYLNGEITNEMVENLNNNKVVKDETIVIPTKNK